MPWAALERCIDLGNLDLARAAVIVVARRDGRRELGLVADELTWTDNDVSWPARFCEIAARRIG